jgi:hypothetical protein
MQHNVHQSSRPPAVTFAVILLGISLAIWLAMVVSAGVNWAHPLSYVLLAVMAGAPALLFWLIFQGKNWARWLFLAQFAVCLLLSPPFFRRLETTYSNFYVFSFGLLLVLELAAAVAFCLPQTRRWFGRGTNSAEAASPKGGPAAPVDDSNTRKEPPSVS